jgi:hypothetical protein
MVFVIDVPANMFDMQFIYGDEILESEFLEQKQCFGLISWLGILFVFRGGDELPFLRLPCIFCLGIVAFVFISGLLHFCF